MEGSGHSLNERYYPGIHLKGLKENHEKPVRTVSRPRYEPGTSRIRSRSVNYSITKSGV
jgi:hypothetical protein